MTAPPTGLADGPRHRAGITAPGWLLVGRVATLAAVVGCVLLQWLNADWFPPEISVSQYGLGPRGWVFSCWAALLALSVLTLARGGPEHAARQRPWVYGWLAVGCVGLVVMGIVRTDAGGGQQSWHARTHQVGSILALLALPVGIVLALGRAPRPWRRAGVALAVLSVASLLLVLAAALGVPTPGWNAQQSWAFWQSVAVTVDMMLVVVFAVADGTTRDGPGSRESTAGPRSGDGEIRVP